MQENIVDEFTRVTANVFLTTDPSNPVTIEFKAVLEGVEDDIIKKVYEGSGSNESRTARLLGLSRGKVRKALGKGGKNRSLFKEIKEGLDK